MSEAIEKRMELDAEPERVWRALTIGSELAQWFPDRAFDMTAGAAGDLFWRKHGHYAARVEAFEPPSYLAWRWVRDAESDVDSGVTTLVEFRLTPRVAGGTILELRESGFVRPEDRESNDGGWDHELGELVQYLRA